MNTENILKNDVSSKEFIKLIYEVCKEKPYLIQDVFKNDVKNLKERDFYVKLFNNTLEDNQHDCIENGRF